MTIETKHLLNGHDVGLSSKCLVASIGSCFVLLLLHNITWVKKSWFKGLKTARDDVLGAPWLYGMYVNPLQSHQNDLHDHDKAP
jgi:hypothetical protein